ncbi:MAG: multidrug efflux RND transporter permease subunit [Schwartzia sp.]|nr:multidrug efflux RND transporter permease subunit [Schwartzia sp. (in: firmicutes)]
MPRFFIDRPVFAIVVALLMVILGTIAGLNLPIAQYPQISPPTVKVNTTYTGASGKVVNDTVAQVIEQQVNGTQGMDYMTSTSDDSGAYTLYVYFDLGTNGDMDSVLVQNRVSVANSSLPTEVLNYGITTQKSSQDMTYVGSLCSPNGSFGRDYLKNYLDIYILDQIKRVRGVGDVQIFGTDYTMRVWINPDKIAELNITISDITTALREQNVQAAGGTVGMLPAPDTQERQYTGIVQGRLETPEEFQNVIVKAGENGSFVRLGDIARIAPGEMMMATQCVTDGQTSVGFAVMLTDDANAMETVAGVKKVIEEAKKNFPPDMVYVENIDNTMFITASLEEVVETFVEALIIVMVVVFVFLQNWRATLIPMLAVPVSLIATLAAFIVLGFTINTLTLFAMVLAIGLVVDDAIVVIENVEEHMEKDHLGPKEAAQVAMDEVQGAVIATTFVLVAVFVPVAFLGGMMGVLYKQFALTMSVSVCFSTLIALTLTPALCATMLKPHDPNAKKGVFDKFFDKFNDWFERMKNNYTGKAAWFIAHSNIAIIALVVFACGFYVLDKIVPSTFVPDEDQGYFIASVTMPEGTSLNRTEDTINRLSAEISEFPGVIHVMSIAGYDVTTSAAKSSSGSVFIGLDDWDKRKTPETQINALIGQIFKIGVMHYPEASIIAFNVPSLPGLGNVGGFSLQLQDLSGHTDEELNQLAQDIVKEANSRQELKGVYTTFKINTPIYNFDIDREKVKTLGVALSDVFTALQVNFGGTVVNDFNRFGRTYKVMLQSDTTYRNEVEAAKFVYMRNNIGTMIPLDALIIPRVNTGASILSRFNSSRCITIQGNAADGYSSGQAIATIEEIARAKAPSGFSIDWSGQSREEKKAGSKMGQVLLMALVFVFLCLAALYESWSVPFSVLMTVPVGVFGCYLAEFITGQENSIYMQIGLIMIMGLAAKNAILIVEFAKADKDNGMTAVDAAVTAAGMRLRPILMTSFAFILGCLPLAVATGAGAGARNGMGVAVVGGSLCATAVGIFLIPVFYVIVENVSDYLNKKLEKVMD